MSVCARACARRRVGSLLFLVLVVLLWGRLRGQSGRSGYPSSPPPSACMPTARQVPEDGKSLVSLASLHPARPGRRGKCPALGRLGLGLLGPLRWAGLCFLRPRRRHSRRTWIWGSQQWPASWSEIAGTQQDREYKRSRWVTLKALQSRAIAGSATLQDAQMLSWFLAW